MILLLKMGIKGEILGEIFLLLELPFFSPIHNQGKSKRNMEK